MEQVTGSLKDAIRLSWKIKDSGEKAMNMWDLGYLYNCFHFISYLKETI